MELTILLNEDLLPTILTLMYLISVGLNQTSFKGIYSDNDTLPHRTRSFLDL